MLSLLMVQEKDSCSIRTCKIYYLLAMKEYLCICHIGLFSIRSIVALNSKCNVMLYNNSANTNGGAIFLNDSKIYFDENFTHEFYKN